MVVASGMTLVTQMRAFEVAAQGFENDVTIGATALENGIPLITGGADQASAVMKLGGEVRWFAPGA